MTKRTPPSSPEVRERAVRMVLDHQGEHGSQYAAIQSIAAKIGCSGETPRNWVCQAARDRGLRAAPPADERERGAGCAPALTAASRATASMRRPVYAAPLHINSS